MMMMMNICLILSSKFGFDTKTLFVHMPNYLELIHIKTVT